MSNYPQLPENEDRDNRNINRAVMPLSRSEQPEVARYPFSAPSSVPEPEPDDLQALLQLLQVLWRHKGLLALSLLSGIFAAAALSLYMTPLYRATSILEIQSVREMFPTAGQVSTDASTESVITESQLLTSNALRQRVLSRLNSAAAPPVPNDSGFLPSLRRLLRLRDTAESVTWREAVAIAGGTLQVQPGRDSRLITVQSDSPSPRAAADFANGLTEEYLQGNQEQRWEAYQKTSGWLNRAQEELKAKLEKSEKALSDFARSAGLILTSDTQNLAEGRLKELQTEMGRATANRIEKQSAMDSNESGRRNSVPEVFNSGAMEAYQNKLADLRAHLVELTVTLTPEHYKVKQ